MKKYDFDEVIERNGTNSLKFDGRKQVFWNRRSFAYVGG